MSDYTENTEKRSVTVPLRPVKGIYRDISPTMVPIGGFSDIDGFVVDESGLVRRFGTETLETIFPDITRWDYLDSFIDNLGYKITYGIGDGTFFALTGSGFTPLPNQFPNSYSTPGSVITLTIGKYLVTGDTANTKWVSEGGIARGDLLTTELGHQYTVDRVVSETELIITTPATADETDAIYVIERMLTPAADWAIQAVRLDRMIYIVTGKNTVFIFNIDNPTEILTYWEEASRQSITLTSDPTLRNFIPKTIEAFKDRIWLGNIFVLGTTSDHLYTSRISWTPVLSPLDFLPIKHYVDLIEVGGEISALKTLSNLLMVYSEFGLQFGRETAIPGDVLPLAFDKVQNTDRGVLQPDAVVSAAMGHFYASVDNVYYIGTNLVTAPVGNNVKDLMFRKELIKSRYKAFVFLESEGIGFACSEVEGSYEEIWTYQLSSKEWAKFSIVADTVATFALGGRRTYLDFPADQMYGADPLTKCDTPDWDTRRDGTTGYFLYAHVQNDDMSNGLDNVGINDKFPIYAATPEEIETNTVVGPENYSKCDLIFAGTDMSLSTNRLYLTNGPMIHNYSSDRNANYDGSAILVYLETGDLDLNKPDVYKTFYKLSMRIAANLDVDLNFRIEASNDDGNTWYDISRLVIYSGTKEGRSNFIFTGSAPRFRIASDTISTSYIILEITLDVKMRGRQFGAY